jgi:hypothetical protein
MMTVEAQRPSRIIALSAEGLIHAKDLPGFGSLYPRRDLSMP